MNLEWSPSTHWKCIELVFPLPQLPFDIGHASKFHREKVHDIYSLATKAFRRIRWMNNQCNLLSETFQFSKTCWRWIFKQVTKTCNSSTWKYTHDEILPPLLVRSGQLKKPSLTLSLTCVNSGIDIPLSLQCKILQYKNLWHLPIEKQDFFPLYNYEINKLLHESGVGHRHLVAGFENV